MPIDTVNQTESLNFDGRKFKVTSPTSTLTRLFYISNRNECCIFVKFSGSVVGRNIIATADITGKLGIYNNCVTHIITELNIGSEIIVRYKF